MALKLTPNTPVASQGDFFSGTSEPVYSADLIAAYGDPLRSMILERAMGPARAAESLGISEDDLRKALRGGFKFDLTEARQLLRGGAR